jgi:hypothetical protein
MAAFISIKLKASRKQRNLGLSMSNAALISIVGAASVGRSAPTNSFSIIELAIKACK